MMVKLSFNRRSLSSLIDIEVLSVDECEEKIRKLFDKALLVFLEEEGSSSHRTLPVKLGNGKKVDLFKLFVLVRERGGCDSVSRRGLWGLVAEKLEFDRLVSPSVRLIYFKYLNRMEEWAKNASRIVNWENQDCKKNGCYGGILHELGEGFKGLLANGSSQNLNLAMVVGCSDHEESSSEFQRSMKRSRVSSSHDGERLEVSCVVLADDYAVSTKVQDPSIGVIPHHSQWEMHTGNARWIETVRAKNALVVQRGNNPEFNRQNSSYKDLQIHPSIYDEVPKSVARKQISAGRRDVTGGTSRTAGRRDVTGGTSRTTTDLAAVITEPDQSWLETRCVPVGPEHQAQVDEWTGSGSASDTKWLGTLIWPLKNEEAIDDLVGKGRPDSCNCIFRNSIECSRFHVAEKRMEVKREIGTAFLKWRFNEMGEEVSLRWTGKEEKLFKEMIIADPLNFWKKAGRCFKGKKRAQVVSYFFNVFLINKRRYQNRVTANHIDSDDEDAFGSVGRRFGIDDVTLFDTDITICSQNRQSDEF